jgi:hypothetical protein
VVPRSQVQVLDDEPLKPDVLRSLEVLAHEDLVDGEGGKPLPITKLPKVRPQSFKGMNFPSDETPRIISGSRGQ